MCKWCGCSHYIIHINVKVNLLFNVISVIVIKKELNQTITIPKFLGVSKVSESLCLSAWMNNKWIIKIFLWNMSSKQCFHFPLNVMHVHVISLSWQFKLPWCLVRYNSFTLLDQWCVSLSWHKRMRLLLAYQNIFASSWDDL